MHFAEPLRVDISKKTWRPCPLVRRRHESCWAFLGLFRVGDASNTLSVTPAAHHADPVHETFRARSVSPMPK